MSGWDHRTLVSFDGTRLDYAVRGEGSRWLVMINGLGSTYSSWEPLATLLESRWRLLCWDLRGLFASAVPADRRRLDVRSHARDLEQLLHAEAIPTAVLAGWSMGVQVGLETYRAVPERVSALVLIAGTQGRFFSRCFHIPLARVAIPLAVRASQPVAPAISAAVRWAVNRPNLPRWLRRLGMSASDSPRLAEEARHFGRIDWGVYMLMAQTMETHDGSEMLSTVRVPTLIVGGDRDILAPPRVLRAMAARIRGARLHILPGGTHYTILEDPSRLNEEVLTFLQRHFAAPRPQGAGT